MSAPILDDSQLYDRDYFDGYYLHDPKREVMYRQEAARLQARVKPGHILDVGCGTGGFLRALRGDWGLWGIEPSEFARKVAFQRGISVFASFDDIPVPVYRYDTIVFRGTLQHISEPLRALSEATQILETGGLLAILATPDTDSLVYKLWGKLPALDAPRNWVIFGHIELTNILQRLGYKDIEIIYPYWDTPYASPLADFAKFAFSLFFGWRKFAFPGNMLEIYARKA